MKKTLILTMLSFSFLFHANGQDFKGRSNTINVRIGSPGEGLVVEWITPRDDQLKVRSSAFTVEAGIIGEQEISSVDVYLNGRKTQSRGFKVVPSVDNRYNKLISQELHLMEGENDITLSIIEGTGHVITESRKVFFLAGESPSVDRTDYALLFGTDHYDSWDDLVNPVKDTRTIAGELEESYGFRVEVVEDPTTEEVWNTIRAYAQKSYMENDQLFIFFAGHGQFDDVFGEGYLVCRDSRLNDQSKSSYISHVRLRNIINNIPCKHVFLVIDACFGGTFDPLIARAGLRGNEQVGELPKTEFINRKLRFKTRRYLTSGGKVYVPDGRPGHHSPFARKFLEALRSYGGNDQVVTLFEIVNTVERIDPEPRFGEFGDNEPGSDFIFEAR